MSEKIAGRRQAKSKLGRNAARSAEWPPKWHDLAVAYGGPKALAEKLGVHYQTLWRWALRGANIPPIAAKVIRQLAVDARVPSPVND